MLHAINGMYFTFFRDSYAYMQHTSARPNGENMPRTWVKKGLRVVEEANREADARSSRREEGAEVEIADVSEVTLIGGMHTTHHPGRIASVH